MKNLKFLAAALVAGGVAFGGTMMSTSAFAGQPAATPATPAQPSEKGGKRHDDKKAETAALKIGDTAPSFSLTDTDGKTVALSDYKGKIVVLEWFNPECPYIHKHHDPEVGNMTFNNLYTEYNSKNVVFLAINSTAKGVQGNGKEYNVKMKGEFKMPYAILLDESGATGHAYGAKTTPHVFIVGTDGKLAYMGAIDNNDDIKKAGDKNYAKLALDEMLAGKKVTTTTSKPYGCGVKYTK